MISEKITKNMQSKAVLLIYIITFTLLFSCEKVSSPSEVNIRRFYLVAERFDFNDNQILYYDKRNLTKLEVKCLIELFDIEGIDYYISSTDQIYIESTPDDEHRIGVDYVLTGDINLCVKEKRKNKIKR